MKRGLHWFRADLRMTDNTALLHAIKESDELLAIFIMTQKTFELHHEALIKIQFIVNNLQYLSCKLAQQGIPLLIQEVDYFSDCPELLNKICLQYKVDGLYFNKQYEVNEMRRDERVKKMLRQQGIEIYSYDDQTVMPPGSVLSQRDMPLQIFTPFKKAWLNKVILSSAWRNQENENKLFFSSIKADKIPQSISGLDYVADMSAWPVGEEQAKKILNSFCSEKINHYHLERNFPSLDSTSHLSAYLAAGIISPRQCIAAIIKNLNIASLEEILNYPGPTTWLSEFIWREFYKHIMYHFPQICCYKPLRMQTENLAWSYDTTHFQAWCEGMTGFPLVDAAMRQLNQTGWMHNRLRMLTAMFLSKILFLDWRLGERYFMQKLIDGDLSANNGGWQWSASTGTDAVPYFRIFNPIKQSERYDPEGIFIRKYCPELKNLDNYTIHDPYERGVIAGELNYPQPIVNYKQKRKETIAAFKGM